MMFSGKERAIAHLEPKVEINSPTYEIYCLSLAMEAWPVFSGLEPRIIVVWNPDDIVRVDIIRYYQILSDIISVSSLLWWDILSLVDNCLLRRWPPSRQSINFIMMTSLDHSTPIRLPVQYLVRVGTSCWNTSTLHYIRSEGRELE